MFLGTSVPFFVLLADFILRRHADGELHFYCESLQIKQLYVLTKPFIFKTCSQNEVGNLTKKTENEVYFVKSASNKSLSFLYHLRNSIAHCLIEKEGKRYKFADKNRSKELTMIGTIDCSILD